MLYTRPNNLAHARLGVVAAKRLAPRAVTRNMIKRLARELFRKACLPPVDCIIRLTKAVGTPAQSAASRDKKRRIGGELSRLLLSQSQGEAP